MKCFYKVMILHKGYKWIILSILRWLLGNIIITLLFIEPFQIGGVSCVTIR